MLQICSYLAGHGYCSDREELWESRPQGRKKKWCSNVGVWRRKAEMHADKGETECVRVQKPKGKKRGIIWGGWEIFLYPCKTQESLLQGRSISFSLVSIWIRLPLCVWATQDAHKGRTDISNTLRMILNVTIFSFEFSLILSVLCSCSSLYESAICSGT